MLARDSLQAAFDRIEADGQKAREIRKQHGEQRALQQQHRRAIAKPRSQQALQRLLSMTIGTSDSDREHGARHRVADRRDADDAAREAIDCWRRRTYASSKLAATITSAALPAKQQAARDEAPVARIQVAGSVSDHPDQQLRHRQHERQQEDRGDKRDRQPTAQPAQLHSWRIAI